MSVLTQIAQAVTDELNAGEFSQEFAAERAYQPLFELPDMKTLHVTVIASGITIHRASRGLIQHDYRIEIGVQKKFAKDDATELDPLMDLVEEVADFLRATRLAAVSRAPCVRIENEPIYSQDHMEQFRQFTSVLTLTYRLSR
ncbi:MAG: hypothetical protein ACOC8E_08775 [Planctomycetota bacterium]